MKILLDTLIGDKRLNDFMHAADVFEPGKQLANLRQIKMELSDDEKIETVCERIKTSLESEMNVVFVAVREIEGVRSNEPHAYIKPEVQTISIGSKYGLFKDILEQMGYKAQTSKHMHVLSVTTIK